MILARYVDEQNASPVTRLLARCRKTATGCIESSATPSLVYPKLRVNGKSIRAVQLAYETFVGPVPEGLLLDHLCKNTRCINPLHVEPVTPRENILRSSCPAANNARKTHCVRGHPLSGDNIYIWRGQRICRICRSWNHAARKELDQ